jgi:heavy metal translocating P-type ATPase
MVDEETPLSKAWGKNEYQIIHWNERRIRFRVFGLATSPAYVKNLQAIIESLDFVTNVRINAAAESLAVEYEPGRWTKFQDQSENYLQELQIQELQAKLIHCIQTASLVVPAPESLPVVFHPAEVEDITSNTTHTVGYEVIHKNPFYLRIKVPRLTDDTEYCQKVKYLANSLNLVTSVRVNPAASSIAVEFDHRANPAQVEKSQHLLLIVIQQAVYLEIDDFTFINIEDKTQETSSRPEIDYWERLAPPAISMVLGLGMVLGLPLPIPLVGGMLFLAAIPVFKRAIVALQQDRKLTVDFLDGVAVSLHSYHGAFFAPALMVGLIETGEVIRDLTARGSERESLNLLDCLNKSALVERDGQEIQIPVKDIVVGDRVIVYPGDQIPVDGRILEGIGLIDQCKLTGESVPITRTVTEEVFASSLLVDGQLRILAERVGINTRAGMVVNLMQSAPVHDTRVENYAAAVANQLVLPTLILSTVVGVLSGDVTRTISLLTLDMGTGIRISVPTAILSALTYAARHGVLIRNGRAIEMLAKIDTVVFDKTGTLTQGHAGITNIHLAQSQISELEILSLAATAEQGLTHPVAEAIVRHAKREQVPLGECETWEYRVGLGVVARVDGIDLLVGSDRLMKSENISLAVLSAETLGKDGQSLVYIAGNGQLLGVICYSDPPRPESQEVIQELKQQGLTPYMLSGDAKRVAYAIADQLNISPHCVYAEAFPERKVEVVRGLHDSGKTVAFCGDGINDSAALAYADVSISFAGATDIARETADVVLMENNLQGLLSAIKISRQAMAIVNQNIWSVSVPNLLGIAAGSLFPLNPILAILINNGSAILASLNSLRPLLGPEAALSGLDGLDRLDVKVLEDSQLPQLVEDFPTESLPISPFDSEVSQKDISLHTVIPFPEQTAPILEEMQHRDLAKRLGITSQSLSRQRTKPEFSEWSRIKDPEGIAWIYLATSKIFIPLESQREKPQTLRSSARYQSA